MSGPNGEPNIAIADGIIEEDDDFDDEEYEAINSMLDQINSCLDDIEERNDSLNGKLRELLESNRQARLEFREKMNEGLAEGQQQSQQHHPSPSTEDTPEPKQDDGGD